MGATLDALLRLQTIENKLRSLHERIDSKRRVVNTQQRRAVALERQIAEIHQTIRRIQGEADRLELDRKTRETHIASLREAINKSKSNKEYSALLTQINTEKADTLKLEDGVLKRLGEVDEARKKEKELNVELEKVKLLTVESMRIAEEHESKLKVELTSLENQRTDAASHIPISVLGIFDRSCEKHEGEAMAAVHRPHPKRTEFVCNGCNMSIPLEVVNALQSGDKIHQCQTCSRILYLEEAGATV